MKYCAIIVETRELHNLCDVIQNHLDYLPEGWDFIMYGSSKNKDSVLKRFPDCKFKEIDYFDFLKEWGQLPHINADQYNRLLASVNLWGKLLEYERVLIFQHDSKMLRKGIEAFLKWDYIGAPWGHFKAPGGNGGLSIRNPKAMYHICHSEKYYPSTDGNEDVFFSKRVSYIAPKEEAMKFSVETIFYPTPIGVHAPEKHLTQSQLKELYQ